MKPTEAIVPFWHRLRAISLYPLQSAALLSLVALTLCRLLTFLPFGIVINFLVSVGLYKYAVAVLQRTANGHMDAPEISTDSDSSGRGQIWLQVVFVLLLIGGFAFLGPVGGSICALILGLAIPAATISLAMDGNFLHALNPLTWMAIATRIGWPYLAVTVLYAVIVISQANATALLAPFMPPVLDVLVSYFLSQYGVLVAFHLMGYMIYQYHEELGFEASAPLARRDANSDPDQDVLDDAEQLVQNGDPRAAEQMIERRLRVRGGTPAVHAQYRKLLKLSGDVDALSRHGRDYLNVLMAQGNEKAAFELARDCFASNPDFTFSEPGQVAPLARRAADTGQTQLAVNMLRGFDRNHPQHPDVVPNALLLARLLTDKLNQEGEARTMLTNVRRANQSHPQCAEMDSYLSFLNNLAMPTSRA
jgi:hypothetical protein